MSDRQPLSLLQLTPLNEAYRMDPHALLDEQRQHSPVAHDAMMSSYLLTRYEDVRAVVNDRSMTRDPFGADRTGPMAERMALRVKPGVPRTHQTSILTLDDPDHSRIRQPLAQAFYARVAKFRPEVERIVDETLDAIAADLDAGAGSFDLMARYCIPIPIDAIASILGVDRSRLDQFRKWSEELILGLNPFGGPDQAAIFERASAELSEHFAELMADRRANPQDDLITDMVQLQAGGAPLEDGEIRLNLIALLVGGNLTTTDLIGNAVRELLRNPEQLATFKADPALINATVEEALRFESPVDITGRVVGEDKPVAGCPMHQRQSLTVSLRAANHDPAVFENPHAFDVGRPKKPHVAFGGGSHICIGAPLARLEAGVALWKLFERFPTLRLADPDAAPEWRRLPFFRGLETLEVAV